ncbi:predicted protein [Sclerotinia sclerotiorum 1980 UF-70]|uniref:Uncharacterized protein n=1 Tax=Sclerotinia sclerotiorum (strain ATCC 18683 / 1980 / Ss-1) TaxID=665079 RepID=A7F410_SCLS1|nr:predicted protein [Sclerotinia sclerotiorum 1980 UF-70]EDN97481.1 predicted protein [Sclerotinia sclerotiorum 1980 UF-70]
MALFYAQGVCSGTLELNLPASRTLTTCIWASQEKRDVDKAQPANFEGLSKLPFLWKHSR